MALVLDASVAIAWAFKGFPLATLDRALADSARSEGVVLLSGASA